MININKNMLQITIQRLSNYLSDIAFVRMPAREQISFMKRLSFLTKAGIPILESLTLIRKQTKNKGRQQILDTLLCDVANGQYLSTGLRKFSHIFDDFTINIIYCGESTGMLSDNLAYLAEELRKKHQLRRKVAGALVYPVIIIISTIGIIGFLMMYLLPKILPVFKSLHTTLPFSTRLVIFVSNIFINYGVLIAVLVMLLILVLTIVYKKVTTFRMYTHVALTKIPFISTMVKQYALANATRSMGLLLKSGSTLTETLELTARVISNKVYQGQFTSMIEVINRGGQLSAYLALHNHLFPNILVEMVAVGERTGNLSTSFLYLSELYENEIDEFTKHIGNLIEPVLMIIVGLLVGMIAISIITPLYEVTQHIRPQ